MSLVVSHLTEEGPRIVSDSRVSFSDGRNPKVKTGTIKSIIITETIAVCFAGDVENGLNAIREFANNLDKSRFDSCIANLCTASEQKPREVEFIVAVAGEVNNLYRVKDGLIESDLRVAWIGDREAFEAFQQEYNEPQDEIQLELMQGLPQSAQTMTRITSAMDKVIANPDIDAVGEFNVRIGSKKGKFNYYGGTFIHLGRDVNVKDGDNLILKMAQSVEEGGYSVSIVEPLKPGTPAFALNFPRAKLGYLFLPLIYDEAQVIHDVYARDFAQVILEKFGVEMSQPMLR